MYNRIGTILVCILLIASSLVIVFPIKAVKVNGNTLYEGGNGPMPISFSIPVCSGYEENPENKVDRLSLDAEKTPFGILAINFSSVNGLPNEEFGGILFNVNATFSGYTEFIVAHVLFPFKSLPIIIQTNETLNVQIKCFFGSVFYEPNGSIVFGFATGITWEYVS